ncbi:MAG: sigma-54-dependent Fis family transcriptional regulator [Gemmatimonadetes bacterium]|nr:sigma-54-dependent Fis family transcriptional regulator [Gemmatimonadota bacterium]
MTRRVLLVDDDPAILQSLGDALSDFGVEVETAASAEEALGNLSRAAPDLVVSDIRMPGMDGIELLQLVRERVPDVDVVLMTAYDDMPTVVRVMREGALDFLVKPIDLLELEQVVRRALDDRRSRERMRRAVEDEARPYQLNELVGRDAKMIEVFKLVGQLAGTRVNVLLRGESGTGKELVARAIHFNSPCAGDPFIPVNCTALPDTLLESELFGHVRGAFTGAVADRRGRFALAGRGTIFLDEIGDTTPEFQAKVLRVLEDGQVFPLGAEEAEETKARVVAATHRDLEQRVEEGRFREDLYYRLRVVEIVLPTLRERSTDIPLLAHHLVQKAAEKQHVPEPALPKATIEALLGYDWPGNVREMENCLTRAIALARGGVIRPEHLGLGSGGTAARGAGVFRTMREMEIQHARQVLEAAGGNKTRTAEILGISKPTLYRLLARDEKEVAGRVDPVTSEDEEASGGSA